MRSKRPNSAAVAVIALLFALLLVENLEADEFTWTAKRQWSRLSEGRELTILSGGAVITSDATTIVADEIELWGTDFRYSMAKGSVTATDTERGIILKSDTLFYDREEEVIRVDGFIDMQDLKNDVVARGGFFEYFGKDEVAYIQIGVRILKVDEDTELACRSEFAKYMREDEILELSGMPHVTRNKDVYTAARITINLDTDEILLDRDVSGRLVTESAGEPANGDAAAQDSGGQVPGAAPDALVPPPGNVPGTDEEAGAPADSGGGGEEAPPAGVTDSGATTNESVPPAVDANNTGENE